MALTFTINSISPHITNQTKYKNSKASIFIYEETKLKVASLNYEFQVYEFL